MTQTAQQATPFSQTNAQPNSTPAAPLTRIEPPPMKNAQIETAKADRQAFNQKFTPIRTADPEVLIVNWGEIERQFLDLCAPWDRQATLNKLMLARQTAFWETPEQTLRWLWVLAHCSSDLDTPQPIDGTGEHLPMP